MTEKRWIHGTKLKPGDVCVVYLSSFADNERWTILLVEKIETKKLNITEWRYIRLTPENTVHVQGPLYVYEKDPGEFEVLERLPAIPPSLDL